MRMPNSLRKLDDRVLGSKGSGRTDRPRDADHPDDHHGDETDESREGSPRGEGERTRSTKRTERTEESSRGNGDGLQTLLATVWRIARLVLMALALLLLIAIAFIILPTNEDNVIVRNVLDWADTVAGPFRDVFDADDGDRGRIYNYGLAAVVYFILGSIIGKLPTGSKKAG